MLWALTPPGYMPELHLGVRSVKSQKLMAIITGVPATVCPTDAKKRFPEIHVVLFRPEPHELFFYF